jgi:hypothetical protein
MQHNFNAGWYPIKPMFYKLFIQNPITNILDHFQFCAGGYNIINIINFYITFHP